MTSPGQTAYVLGWIVHNYDAKNKTIKPNPSIPVAVLKTQVEEVRKTMGDLIIKNYEAANHYTSSFGSLFPHKSVDDYETYLKKAGFQFHNKTTVGAEQRDYQEHIQKRLTADDGFFNFTKIILTLFQKCFDMDQTLPTVTSATHQNGQGSKVNHTIAAHMFAVGLTNLSDVQQNLKEYKTFITQHARTSEINVYVNSSGVEVIIDKAQRKFITHLHSLPIQRIAELLKDDNQLRLVYETHYLVVVDKDIRAEQDRVRKITPHQHSTWHKIAYDAVQDILTKRKVAV